MELVMVFSKAFTGRGERGLNIKAAKIRTDNLIEYLNILTMFHCPLSEGFWIAEFGFKPNIV